MTFGSVCSGIEAASVAWTPLGWRCAFVAEIDPFPCAVLAHHYPGVPNLGDFTRIPASAGPIDVLVGGTPCQSFSVAGLRRGLDDDRGNLALEFLRLAGRLRPAWLVWENVPGVLSSNGGRDFGAFLGGLVELGYGFAYRVLDAQHFGVPQRRRRVFVVGHLGDWRRPAAVLFERDCLSRNPPPERESGADAACFTPGRIAGYSEGAGPLRAAVSACGPGSENLTVARALTGHHGRSDGDTETFVAHTLRAAGFDASEDGTGRGTPLVPVAFDYGVSITSGSKMVGDPDGPAFSAMAGRQQAVAFGWYERSGATASEVSQTLKCSDGKTPAVAYNIIGLAQEGRNHAYEATVSGCLQHKGLAASGNEAGTLVAQAVDLQNTRLGDDVSGTLDTSSPSRGGGQAVLQSMAVRRLTLLECARLQGFPDDYLSVVTYRGKCPPADGPMYKALGNSMAIPPMIWLGRRITMVSRMA